MRLFKGSSNKRLEGVDKLMTRRNDKIIASLRKDRLVKEEVEKVTTKFDSLKPHKCEFQWTDDTKRWGLCYVCRSFTWDKTKVVGDKVHKK